MTLIKGGIPKKEKTIFLVVLALLVILIIALALILIALANKQNADKDAEDYASLREGDYDDGYNVRLKLTDMYNEGEKEKALNLFDVAKRQSLTEKNYELYVFLIGDEFELMGDDERCKTGLKLFEDINVDQWPTEDKYMFYTEARNANEECGNDAKTKEYESKIDAMIEKGELNEEDLGEG